MIDNGPADSFYSDPFATSARVFRGSDDETLTRDAQMHDAPAIPRALPSGPIHGPIRPHRVGDCSGTCYTHNAFDCYDTRRRSPRHGEYVIGIPEHGAIY